MSSKRTILNVARALIVAGSLFTLAWVSLMWVAAHYSGVQYRCLVAGPFQESPPYALSSEAVEVRGSFSWTRLGRVCEWERADGLGFVTALPDWSWALPALLAILISVIGLALLVVQTKAKPKDASWK